MQQIETHVIERDKQDNCVLVPAYLIKVAALNPNLYAHVVSLRFNAREGRSSTNSRTVFLTSTHIPTQLAGAKVSPAHEDQNTTHDGVTTEEKSCKRNYCSEEYASLALGSKDAKE